MDRSDDYFDEQIDWLVRKRLEEQAEEIDTTRLLARVDASMAADLQATPVARPHAGRRGWPMKLVWTAAAVVVLAAVGGLLRLWPDDVQAASVIRESLEVHRLPVERCYTVTVDRDVEIQEEQPQFRDVLIWTQGDRFWVDVRGQRAWKWGRSGSGAIWIVWRRHRALEIEADEIGPPLQQIADLYSLHLETLLENLLNHFELEHSDNGSFTHVITARPRGWASGYIREAVIEVDKETKAVKQLELRRSFPRRGNSRITFTLVDARTADDSKYEPAGHLDEPFRILTRDLDPDKRRDVLTSWFGPQAARWLVESPSSSTSQED